ncbi:MAG: hypothetical protein M0P92_06260 [Acholeplasmataceae bacterium]|nr:hypothetical protein [Acholeplasmataceae bacterium]
MEIENIEWKFLKMRRLLLAKVIRIFPFVFFTILSIGIESLKGAFSFGDFNSELFFGLIVFGIILNTLLNKQLKKISEYYQKLLNDLE